jgi:lipoprotein-releasing system permease protein
LFELSIAWKYLLPKRRQLSVSIISLISILVISLVIWLILLFFSVSRGLEKGWIEKLTSLTAPVRMTPTEEYYRSYYFQIDKSSQATDYSPRTLGEKLLAETSDPYNPAEDEELSTLFPKPDLDANGTLKDLVKLAHESVTELKGYQGFAIDEFALTSANLRLRLLRGIQKGQEANQAFLNHAVYVGAHFGENPAFTKTLLKPTPRDIEHSQEIAYLSQDEIFLDEPAKLTRSTKPIEEKGDPLYVPKSFRDGGVLQGDHGFLSFYAATASSMQEQRVPVYVAGFYDAGIVPLGGKFILTTPDLVKTLRSAQQQDSAVATNGFNIRLQNLDDAEALKAQLEQALKDKGIASYWKVETFRDYDYAKDLLQQLSSEKHLFGFISLIILTVACSNIITLLIILVNNKRVEIGILRSMGATSTSIAAIFGLCGFAMGLIGTVIGSILALYTLRNLDALIGLMSRLQGFDAFNPLFYGDQLPNEMSYEVLTVVLIATGTISLIAGLVPALKASRVKPAEILRADG